MLSQVSDMRPIIQKSTINNEFDKYKCIEMCMLEQVKVREARDIVNCLLYEIVD